MSTGKSSTAVSPSTELDLGTKAAAIKKGADQGKGMGNRFQKQEQEKAAGSPSIADHVKHNTGLMNAINEWRANSSLRADSAGTIQNASARVDSVNTQPSAPPFGYFDFKALANGGANVDAAGGVDAAVDPKQQEAKKEATIAEDAHTRVLNDLTTRLRMDANSLSERIPGVFLARALAHSGTASTQALENMLSKLTTFDAALTGLEGRKDAWKAAHEHGAPHQVALADQELAKPSLIPPAFVDHEHHKRQQGAHNIG